MSRKGPLVGGVMSYRSSALIRRVIDWWQRQSEAISPELAACEFECRKTECDEGKFENCDRRLTMARLLTRKAADATAPAQPEAPIITPQPARPGPQGAHQQGDGPRRRALPQLRLIAFGPKRADACRRGRAGAQASGEAEMTTIACAKGYSSVSESSIAAAKPAGVSVANRRVAPPDSRRNGLPEGRLSTSISR